MQGTENGYFYPMMFPNPAYPGQAIMEQKWNLKEIEQEFRAQIETTLKSIPQLKMCIRDSRVPCCC